MRVRWACVFLIGLISKPCACHDALIPALSASKKKQKTKKKPLSLPLSPSNQMQLLKGEMSSSKQISYHMTALPWVNLRSSCIREQFPEGKKTGRKEKKKIKLLAAPCFPNKQLQPQLPKKRRYFRRSIHLSGGQEMCSRIRFPW